MSGEIYRWSADMFLRAFVNGWVVDGRAGGLITGRSHADGHIVMLQPTSELGEYEMLGLIEGGEYVLCPEASEAHYDRIEEINADNGKCAPHQIRTPSRIIHTSAEPHDKFLIIQKGQWIVNINSTNRHFEEIDRINSEYNHFSGRVLHDEEIDALMQIRFD